MKTISLRTFGLFLVYKKSIQSPNSHGLLPLRDQSPERVGGRGGEAGGIFIGRDNIDFRENGGREGSVNANRI